MKRLVILGLLASAKFAAAQTVQPCDWIARADAIVEPWSENTRTFANGDVRLALLDVVEPAAGSYHILILSPPYNELGERQCMTAGASENIGFYAADFTSLKAGYDPVVGLKFEMDVKIFDGETPLDRRLNLTLNQSSGVIGTTLK